MEHPILVWPDLSGDTKVKSGQPTHTHAQHTHTHICVCMFVVCMYLYLYYSRVIK